MSEFFENRLDGYDEHMMTNIESAASSIRLLPSKLPAVKNCRVLDLPFGETVFDAAVSVESLHHFTKEEKIPLYVKLHKALKENGFFILTDYFSLSDEEELLHQQNLIALKAEQGITDHEFYHYDTPLTVEHETEALLQAGFSVVEVLNNWGATYTLKAMK